MIRKILGRNPSRPHDLERRLMLAKYIPQIPPPPASTNWRQSVSQWLMLLNDQIGDCAIAAPDHQVMLWVAAESKKLIKPSDSEVQKDYSAVSGYKPGQDWTDVGCNMLDVMRYWQKTGMMLGRVRHKCGPYAAVKGSDATTLRQAINCFGGAYLGMGMPKAWQRIGPNGVWDVATGSNGAAGSWGGHAVYAVDYDAKYLYVVTWGYVQRMTFAAVKKYADEIYAVLSPDWNTDGKAPNGLDSVSLQRDINALQAA